GQRLVLTIPRVSRRGRGQREPGRHGRLCEVTIPISRGRFLRSKPRIQRRVQSGDLVGAGGIRPIAEPRRRSRLTGLDPRTGPYHPIRSELPAWDAEEFRTLILIPRTSTVLTVHGREIGRSGTRRKRWGPFLGSVEGNRLEHSRPPRHAETPTGDPGITEGGRLCHLAGHGAERVRTRGKSAASLSHQLTSVRSDMGNFATVLRTGLAALWEPSIGLAVVVAFGIRLVLIPWFSDPYDFWAGYLSSRVLSAGWNPFSLFAMDPRFQQLGPWP